ncbi:MAG: RES domain-containing protein [Sphingobacteriales bacterium]|nr:MAG: RES domain-containing protein [Sphingobacteriales bacterium]
MLLYRISVCKRASDLSGAGAKLFGGRWNSIGVPMVYMASSRALAALEVLAHLTAIQDPENFCITVFDVPESSVTEIELHLLPDNWNTHPAPSSLKKKSDAFVKSNTALLLKVPSAIIEDEYNYIVNVAHPLLSEIKILSSKPFIFDKRLQ